MPMYPDEMAVLYKQQLQQIEQGQLTQQFGYDFEIHKDGFYQFLELKHGWEQSLIDKEKEEFEKANPARIYSNVSEVPKSDLNSANIFRDYSGPFVPIYCKGDDLSHTTIKPTIIYEEVKGSKIEIPNMPAYKTQDRLGECRAFALGALLQKYTFEKRKLPNCKNPPAHSAISYFGLLVYTNRGTNDDYTFQPNQKNPRNMYEVINDISEDGRQLISEDCKPFENLVKNFTLASDGPIKKNEFFAYLKSIFDMEKAKTSIGSNHYALQMQKISGYIDLNISDAILRKGLNNDDFDQFLYTLFFDDCETSVFPSGFRAAVYPDDSVNATYADLKAKVKEGLSMGKPIMFSGVCISGNSGELCDIGHTVVISGYKKVHLIGNSSRLKEVFKIHNSWGAEWQKGNNDGWVDADILVQNTTRVKSSSGYRISSGVVIWLEP